MSQLTLQTVIEDVDAVHRELAKLTVDQLLGAPSALTTTDILESHPVPLRPKTLTYLRKLTNSPQTLEQAESAGRALFACMDLMIEESTASIGDMLRFYIQHGRMHVQGEKIPAAEVVPWLQAQTDFQKREEMQNENRIFFKGIINPMLLAMLELTVKAAKERFGFENYARYAEAKKELSFDEHVKQFEKFLADTRSLYFQKMTPWVERKIGRPFRNLSRYHALYLMRIRRFDGYFPVERLSELMKQTFRGVGLDLDSRPDVTMDIADYPSKSPEAMCVGVEVPGEVYVIMKPVGGLIDVETLLHEMGHAFFLSHMNAELPAEYRRMRRSSALDECFAFLFMNLLENHSWLVDVAGLDSEKADELSDVFGTKKLCLIRRYMGKFLAEKELHETGEIKNSEYYCRHMAEATGFIYEPEGYLVDMESDFYALDYLAAWAGADILRKFLELRFGDTWYARKEAGEFLKSIAAQGRKYPLRQVISKFCGEELKMPEFRAA
ncbi:hypothetical protein [Desulfomonile tiedjei]|uniref:Peptidase M3 n=1 Tax=Desulfomonile tiedjei (strain ATCC 49306 / DSM 6799 / DCB-1) TaxID=706587 RepID=I4C342_DESTA|nr:hypothetical protein [Desulfomonile tiedjei]AFM23983.1 hypothetical protein Desti_1270 [Desulfomonile tiedjei DSM 6799]